MSTKAYGTDYLFLFTYGNDLLWDMVFILIFSIICLFIQIDINRYCWKRSPVFIYLSKSLVVTHCFRFNNNYLFVYLLKFMSSKAGGTDHLFLFICLWIKKLEITFCITWHRGQTIERRGSTHCQMQWPKRKWCIFLTLMLLKSKYSTFNVFLLYPQIQDYLKLITSL